MAQAKIMIVEDEIIVAEDIKDILKKAGYQITSVAGSGEEAFKKISDIKPDLVLMDIMLEGDLDGIETAERLKEKYNIPVVFVTAYTDQETLQKAKMIEPYGYIIKPFEPVELRTIIELALYKHKKDKESVSGNDNSKTPKKKDKRDIKNKRMFSKKQYEIINVALDIISREGIQKLTLKNITDRMGLTESSIYRHFKSKSDILVAIIKTIEQSFNDSFNRVTNSDESSLERLKMIIFEWFDKYSENQSFIPITLSDDILKGEMELSSNINNITKKNQRLFTDLIVESQKNNEIRKDLEPLHISLIISGTITALIHEWNRAEFKFDLHNEGEKLWNTILKLIISKEKVS